MDEQPYPCLEAVLADCETTKRLQTRVAAVWNAFRSVFYAPGRYDYRYCHPEIKRHLPYQYHYHHDTDGEDVQLKRVDPAHGTMEIGYPGDPGEYAEGSETLPLAWLYTDTWQEELRAKMAAAYEEAAQAQRQAAERTERATYEALKRKYESR